MVQPASHLFLLFSSHHTHGSASARVRAARVPGLRHRCFLEISCYHVADFGDMGMIDFFKVRNYIMGCLEFSYLSVHRYSAVDWVDVTRPTLLNYADHGEYSIVWRHLTLL